VLFKILALQYTYLFRECASNLTHAVCGVDGVRVQRSLASKTCSLCVGAETTHQYGQMVGKGNEVAALVSLTDSGVGMRLLSYSQSA